jgi:hypothetical protein
MAGSYSLLAVSEPFGYSSPISFTLSTSVIPSEDGGAARAEASREPTLSEVEKHLAFVRDCTGRWTFSTTPLRNDFMSSLLKSFQ